MDIRSATTTTLYSMPRPAAGVASPAMMQSSESERVPTTSAAVPSNIDAPAEDSAATEQRPAPIGAASELSSDQLDQLQRLKQRDTDVRAHEQAHVAAGGRYITSGASYDYQIGPDGVQYAIGGEVGIDTSPVAGDPAATLEKARGIRRAALAPAEPSAQDMSVAAAASTMETDALRELNDLALQEKEGRLGEQTRMKTTAANESDELGERGEQESAPPSRLSAQDRLEQRITSFFAAPAAERISQFA